MRSWINRTAVMIGDGRKRNLLKIKENIQEATAEVWRWGRKNGLGK